MKATGRIVLASASPRRREFFEQLGIPVEVIPSDVPETGHGEDPARLALRVAVEKVEAVKAGLGGEFPGWIVGADTVVVLENEIFGKPENDTDARRMLLRLSGVTHQVYTAYRVEASAGEFREGTVRTDVTFARLSGEEIDEYVRSGEPRDKAGAYAIQGRGGAFVLSIRGSYSNVVGLPLWEVLTALRELGAIGDGE